jgi:hypothetical protein
MSKPSTEQQIAALDTALDALNLRARWYTLRGFAVPQRITDAEGVLSEQLSELIEKRKTEERDGLQRALRDVFAYYDDDGGSPC